MTNHPPREPERLVDQDARDRIQKSLDETLIVEAAAGTGKTTELVTRIVAMLASGRARVDGLAAVTFTEKAAGELKLRLRAKLEEERHALAERAAGGGESEADRHANLEDALARLEEARLGTIHGFCADLLRERSVEARVDPEFQTMTEPEAERLFREAFDSWFQEQLRDPPEGVRRALRRVAFERPGGGNPLARQRLAADGGPIARLRQAGWTLANWRDFPADWRLDSFPREEHVDTLVAGLHELARKSATSSYPARDKFFRDTQGVRDLSERIRTAESVRARDYDGLEAQLVAVLDRSLRYAKKGRGKQYGPGVTWDEVCDLHQRFVAALEAFVEQADAHLAACLQRELRDAVERYDVLKSRLGRLDFVDLLVRARDLVRDSAGARRDYQRQFSHVFIDEFQDTDPLQAEILMLLAADDPDATSWREVTPVPGKLFLVGDPKQSIYRFRRADVGTYLDVKDMLVARGAVALTLTTSFRSLPSIQRVVNHAFVESMDGDRDALQADYVPLSPFREDVTSRPTIVALPVPKPTSQYGRVTKGAIEASLPNAVGAFVEWLVTESGWKVTERDSPAPVPVQARHVCILFRRFDSFYAGDITKGYVQALESRGVRHLLVGGRTFHLREEIETVRTALTAIEWPDDELSIFGTLRGPLFAIGDEELLLWRHDPTRKTARRLHPFRVPEADAIPESLHPIREALLLLADLHRARNERPIAETISVLLEATRAHAGFALQPSGEQVLANVLFVAEQARRYEGSGGISFRGFVDQLLEDAGSGKAAEAPILEDDSDGVRLMTVHKAKGLEFPVVILADITASFATQQASRFIDPARGLCAVRVAGWSPLDLIENRGVELKRDQAESVRLAYVAATRARDLLVVPTIGEGPGALGQLGEDLARAGWVAPLMPALYPPRPAWQHAGPAPACPRFGKASVIDDDPTSPAPATVSPGQHEIGEYRVTWWDPKLLGTTPPVVFGIRREDLIKKTVDLSLVQADLETYDRWWTARQSAIADASQPTRRVVRVTDLAGEGLDDGCLSELPELSDIPIDIIEIARAGARPGGKRFGALVHAVLAAVPLRADENAIARVTELQGRILGASEAEVEAARAVVSQVLAHPIVARAAEIESDPATTSAECRRESAVTLRLDPRTNVDGVVDLAFRDGDEWTVVDFKTDREIGDEADAYTAQLRLYAIAIGRATRSPVRGVLMRI